MTDKEKVLSYLKISVVRNDPTGAAIFLILIVCLCCKVVTSRMNCILAGTSLRRMTLTGVDALFGTHIDRQVIPLETAVMVSLVNSFYKLSCSQ